MKRPKRVSRKKSKKMFKKGQKTHSSNTGYTNRGGIRK